MTLPRPVFPDRFVFITRSTTQGTFLLRPDAETNNAFTYLIAEAAQRTGMKVVLPQMMSNHHHTTLYDREGRYSEFIQRFHGLIAKTQNALRDRWENMWDTEEPCAIELLTREDLLEKLVYIATNPVKDGLVEKVHHWPGPKFVSALMNGTPMRATRPKHFFREDGDMPAEIALSLGLPDDFPDKEEFLGELRRRIAEVENAHALERQRTGRRVVGRRGVLRQAWHATSTSHLPRRTLKPRVAARDRSLRIAKIRHDKAWQDAYREARLAMMAGEPHEFPYGTYWLRRFANVRVAPPPESSVNV